MYKKLIRTQYVKQRLGDGRWLLKSEVTRWADDGSSRIFTNFVGEADTEQGIDALKKKVENATR